MRVVVDDCLVGLLYPEPIYLSSALFKNTPATRMYFLKTQRMRKQAKGNNTGAVQWRHAAIVNVITKETPQAVFPAFINFKNSLLVSLMYIWPQRHFGGQWQHPWGRERDLCEYVHKSVWCRDHVKSLFNTSSRGDHHCINKEEALNVKKQSTPILKQFEWVKEQRYSTKHRVAQFEIAKQLRLVHPLQLSEPKFPSAGVKN